MEQTLVAVSMGDPAGVGPEIILESFLSGRIAEEGVAVVVGDLSVLEAVRDRLEIPVTLQPVKDPEEANSVRGVIPVIDLGKIEDPSQLRVGEVSGPAGGASVEYIRAAVELCKEGKAHGLCTAPINKEAIRAAGHDYIGHTEMISEMSNGKKGLTMFTVDSLKIFFHSRHLSLRAAIDAIGSESVVDSLLHTQACLRSVGLPSARIALAALNPHASDGGLFGREEADYLLPAVEEVRRRGLDVEGPVPADSVFAHALRGDYDAVLSLYHDQGHIAAKSYDFYRTVSVTFGYPFIRTSVDHGTAMNIAWQGKANYLSMEEAIMTAFDFARSYRPLYEDG